MNLAIGSVGNRAKNNFDQQFSDGDFTLHVSEKFIYLRFGPHVLITNFILTLYYCFNFWLSYEILG